LHLAHVEEHICAVLLLWLSHGEKETDGPIRRYEGNVKMVLKETGS